MILNQAVNVLKVGLIWLADFVNAMFDPFEEFTRPEELRRHEYLHEKARIFEADMQDFYWLDHNIYRYKLPTDSGDQCLWHGIYTVMQALKKSVDPSDPGKLCLHVEGLRSFQLYGRLIRGWREDGTFQDDVSNDQATGFLAGVYFGWKYGDVHCRDVAKELIADLANEIADHGHCLVNADHKPTRYGRLVDGYKTDPLRLTLCLAVYSVAHKILGTPLYKKLYDDLCNEYGLLLPYASVKLLWLEKTHHAHRAAIHYSILCDLETEHDLHRQYLKGLLRTWRMERKSANPWIYYLMRRICLYDPAYEERVKKHLKEMYLEEKQWNVEKINSDEVATVTWGGHKRGLQPLPRWKVGSQDFFWQRNVHSVDDWVGNKPGDQGLVRHNGGDFLLPYWGLRSLRIIGQDE